LNEVLTTKSALFVNVGYREDFLNLINHFDSISLAEMDKVKLLNRTDIKFVFHKEKLNSILSEAATDYRVLEIDGVRFSNYDTQYFDTENYKFYLDHQNGRADRYKVRMRSYVDSNLHYFEIKHKTNKNRTVKSRIRIPYQERIIQGKAAELLKNKTGLLPEMLKSALRINCKRTTLVNKELSERITIDYDIKYYINKQWHQYPEIIIIEIKQERMRKSEFVQIMRECHLQPVSLSKYCFGIANFIPGIKKNNFKTQILYVNKICNNHAV
jgi:hypothetical protein